MIKSDCRHDKLKIYSFVNEMLLRKDTKTQKIIFVSVADLSIFECPVLLSLKHV